MGESLSDKISGILNAAPKSFDPEDDVHEETRARTVDKSNDFNSDEETAVSQFRKQNVQLLEDVDNRYDGKKGCRKNLLNSDDWDEDEEESVADTANSSEANTESDEEFKSEEEASGEELEEDNTAEDVVDFEHIKDSDVSGEVKKGECVRQQLSMWESLLEIRIQLQKCLVTANKLPQTDSFNEMKDKCGAEFSSKVAESKGNVGDLLDKFLYLQLLLLRKYPETKELLSGNKEMKGGKESDDDEEIPSDTEDEQSPNEEDDAEEVPRKKLKLKNYQTELDKRYNLYKNYHTTVIKKWDDKTRIISSKPGNVVNSVSSQIDHILTDKQKLIKRTQLKRTNYDIVGFPKSENSEEYIENIFDDTDFYHQLLRELIEYKSADITDPVHLSRQWIQLQHLRSKMKRNIDTRATKGRKIRYVVHTKLVNFMAPIDEGTWSDEAKSELYSSLFGKNRPKNSL